MIPVCRSPQVRVRASFLGKRQKDSCTPVLSRLRFPWKRSRFKIQPSLSLCFYSHPLCTSHQNLIDRNMDYKVSLVARRGGNRVPIRTQLDDVSDNTHDNESSTNSLADLCKLLLVGCKSTIISSMFVRRASSDRGKGAPYASGTCS